MGFRLNQISDQSILIDCLRESLINAKKNLRRSLSKGSSAASADVLKGYLAIYAGESRVKRFVIPVSYLNHPKFQNLLSQSEEEFGFGHPMGGLTIPCAEDTFTHLISRLNGSS